MNGTEPEPRLAHSVAAAYGLAFGIAAPFLLFAGSEGQDAVIVLGMLGSLAGPFLVRLRYRPFEAVARVAFSIPLLVFSLVLAVLGFEESLIASPTGALLSFLIVAPGFTTALAALYRPGRWSWLLEVSVCVIGALAWLWTLLRTVVLATWVSAGSLGVFENAVWRSWDWLFTTGSEGMGLVALITLPMSGFATLRLQRAYGPRIAGAFAVVALTVPLLAWSYRLPLLVALPFVAIYVAYRQPALGARVAAALVVGSVFLSLQPFDVSLRDRAGAPGFAPTVAGLLGGKGVEMASRNEIVVVGACSKAYNSPRWVWVW